VIVQPRTSQQILTPNASQSDTNAQRAIDTEIKVIQSRTVKAVRKKLGRVPDISASVAGQTVRRASSAIPVRASWRPRAHRS
jgi:hypothetical protein